MDDGLSGPRDGPPTSPVKDPRVAAIPDIHGHAKGEHKPYAEERPIPYSARMLFLWFYHAARRRRPRFMMVADHINYLTFEDPAAVNLVRRALKLAAAGDLYGAAETAGVELTHSAVVSEGLRRGMRYSIGAEVDNDPRARPDAQNIVEAMKPDGLIRSVHFLQIDHPVHGAGWQWAFDNPEFSSLYEMVGTERVWEIYMATLLEAIDKLPGHIVGHFYVPAKFGHWPDDEKLSAYEDQLVAACRERGMAIELNMRFYYRYIEGGTDRRRYLEANLRLLRKAKEQGVGIAVGSDAHSPKDQGEGFDQALELLDAAEINEIVFPIDGRLARVALRAVREALPEPEPEPTTEPAADAATAAEAAATAKPAKPARPRAARPTKPPARAAEQDASAQSADRHERDEPEREAPARKEPSRKEPSRKEAVRKEPSRKDAARHPASEELPPKDAAANEPAQSEPVHKEPAHKEPPHKEPAHKEPPHKEPAHKEAVHKEPVRKKPLHKESAHKEAAHREPARKEPARKEPARKEPARKEPLPREPAHKEPAHKASPAKAAAHTTKPAPAKGKEADSRRKSAASASVRAVKAGSKAAKKAAKPLRAASKTKTKAKAKKKAVKAPAKSVKRPAPKPRASKAAPRKTAAKKKPTKARR